MQLCFKSKQIQREREKARGRERDTTLKWFGYIVYSEWVVWSLGNGALPKWAKQILLRVSRQDFSHTNIRWRQHALRNCKNRFKKILNKSAALMTWQGKHFKQETAGSGHRNCMKFFFSFFFEICISTATQNINCI